MKIWTSNHYSEAMGHGGNCRRIFHASWDGLRILKSWHPQDFQGVFESCLIIGWKTTSMHQERRSQRVMAPIWPYDHSALKDLLKSIWMLYNGVWRVRPFNPFSDFQKLLTHFWKIGWTTQGRKPCHAMSTDSLGYMNRGANCLNLPWWNLRFVAWMVNWCERSSLQFAPASKCERWSRRNSHQDQVRNSCCLTELPSCWCSTGHCQSKVL